MEMEPVNDLPFEEEDVPEMVETQSEDVSFESSFDYHAVPLDDQMTLDENGVPFTLKELMDLNELRAEE